MPAGRPEIQITGKILKKAEACAARGMTKDQIATALGMGLSTMMEKQIKYPEFLEAIQRGAASGIETITNAMFNTAREGHFPAQKYYLNNRAGWKESTEHEVFGKNGGAIETKFTIEIVDPKKREE